MFPQAQVQTCVVHLIRHSLAFVSYKDRKSVAAALKQIYRATDADAGKAALEAFSEGVWGTKYPAIAQSWRRNWTEVIPFFAFPDDVRRIIYTTNSIESLNAKLRRAVSCIGLDLIGHVSDLWVRLRSPDRFVQPWAATG